MKQIILDVHCLAETPMAAIHKVRSWTLQNERILPGPIVYFDFLTQGREINPRALMMLSEEISFNPLIDRAVCCSLKEGLGRIHRTWDWQDVSMICDASEFEPGVTALQDAWINLGWPPFWENPLETQLLATYGRPSTRPPVVS
jgi:hypothetical protein